MTSTIQLELFENNDESKLLRQELEEVRRLHEKVCRQMSNRHNQLAKLYMQLKEEHELLKRRLMALEKAHHSQNTTSDNNNLMELLFLEAYFGEAN